MKNFKTFDEFLNEGYVGPFMFSDKTSDEELKLMHDAAVSGFANWQKGFEYPKADYKKAYTEIEAILKKRGVKESVNESSTIKISKLSDIDHTRIIKWMNNQFDSNKYDMKKSGSGFEIDIHKLSKIEQEDLMYYLKSQSYINESVNEGMTFGEIKDKFVENPYGIGANAVEFVEGKNGNSSMLIFRHDEKHRRDQIESRLKTLGISPKKMSKSTADKAYKYRYELILHENVLEETNEINEGRSQIKRKYGEHGAIRVNSEAPIRNSILEFVGKRFVTRDELDSHLTQLSEDRGKAVDQNAWF